MSTAINHIGKSKLHLCRPANRFLNRESFLNRKSILNRISRQKIGIESNRDIFWIVHPYYKTSDFYWYILFCI